MEINEALRASWYDNLNKNISLMHKLIIIVAKIYLDCVNFKKKSVLKSVESFSIYDAADSQTHRHLKLLSLGQ